MKARISSAVCRFLMRVHGRVYRWGHPLPSNIGGIVGAAIGSFFRDPPIVITSQDAQSIGSYVDPDVIKAVEGGRIPRGDYWQ